MQHSGTAGPLSDHRTMIIYTGFTLPPVTRALPVNSSVRPRSGMARSTQDSLNNAAICLPTMSLVSVAYRGGWFGVFKPPPPPNSEDIGGVLDRMSKKNRRFDFLL